MELGTPKRCLESFLSAGNCARLVTPLALCFDAAASSNKLSANSLGVNFDQALWTPPGKSPFDTAMFDLAIILDQGNHISDGNYVND